MLITMFTRACHLSLSWARSGQFLPSHHISWRSIFILSFNLCVHCIKYIICICKISFAVNICGEFKESGDLTKSQSSLPLHSKITEVCRIRCYVFYLFIVFILWILWIQFLAFSINFIHSLFLGLLCVAANVSTNSSKIYFAISTTLSKKEHWEQDS